MIEACQSDNMISNQADPSSELLKTSCEAHPKKHFWTPKVFLVKIDIRNANDTVPIIDASGGPQRTYISS